jgi:glycosyltransferase involved in cell wall biosynthesis
MPTVSIIIPAYNEEAFIGTVLGRVIGVNTESIGFTKEIVVVDDGSKDGTSNVVARFPDVRLIRQENQGKGRAVQRGIREATGDYILVQDADLEYDPADYLPMLGELARRGGVIYGSRVLGQLRDRGWSLTPGRHPRQSLGPWVANVLLTLWTFLLYGRWITDTLTGYKIYQRDFFSQVEIVTRGFETDHEITAKLIRRGVQIHEVPILFAPRTEEEGKKIRARDGLIAVWTLLRFRFGRIPDPRGQTYA